MNDQPQTILAKNDYELHVLEATYEAFSKVPYETQQRMLTWLSEKLADDKMKGKS